MIIKTFNQGTGKGSPIINYLFSEEQHENFKPELVKGNAKLTEAIIDCTTRKHKYTAGVISFRDGETLDHKQQLDLIKDFERTFAPFREDNRINFLWVRHMDKGRLELHYVSPMTDLKTGLQFNITPPGKINQDFYKKYQSIKNYEYGFKQVEKDKTIRFNDYKQLTKEVDNYVSKRIDFIVSKFDTPKKINMINKKGVKNGSSRISRQNVKSINGNYKQHGELSKLVIFKNDTVRKKLSNDGRDTTTRTTNDITFTKAFNPVAKFNITRPARGGKQGSTKQSISYGKKSPVLMGSLDDQILALAIQLNTADPWESNLIYFQLAELQSQKLKNAGINHSLINTPAKPKFK